MANRLFSLFFAVLLIISALPGFSNNTEHRLTKYEVDHAAPAAPVFTPDSRHLLYGEELDEHAKATRIWGMDTETGKTEILGTVAHQKKSVNRFPMFMGPVGGTNGLKHIFLAARGKDRFWIWHRETDTIEKVTKETGDTFMRVKAIPGQSSDGTYIAFTENRKKLIIIDTTAGIPVKYDYAVDQREYLNNVSWAGPNLYWNRWNETGIVWPAEKKKHIPIPSEKRSMIRVLPVTPSQPDRVLLSRHKDLINLNISTGETKTVSTINNSFSAGWYANHSENFVLGLGSSAKERHSDTDITITLYPTASDGTSNGKPFKVSLKKEFKPLVKAAEDEWEHPKMNTRYRRLEHDIDVIGVNSCSVYLMLKREIRYGIMGTVYGRIIRIDLAEAHAIAGDPGLIHTWTSSGVTSEDFPNISSSSDGKKVFFRQNNTIVLFR